MEQTVFFITLIMIVLAGYYSLVIFPKQRDFQKHQRFVAQMDVGDEVITSGGIIGVITDLDAETGIARIAIAQDVEMRIITAAIRPFDREAIARSARLALGETVEEG
ncbi:MAG: preprotein translocase subunit YajC [Anaerolineales bacterium]